MRNEKTAVREYPLPHPANELSDDVERLRQALRQIDSDINRLLMASGELPFPEIQAGDGGKPLVVDAAENGFVYGQVSASMVTEEVDRRFMSDAEKDMLASGKVGLKESDVIALILALG